MKQRSKVIATSIATIAMCASLAVGGTFALFTSESEVNIAVTSGKVDVFASVNEESLKTYSMGAIQEKGKFQNGGTAAFNAQSQLELSLMTPGDKAEFTVDIANNSNVAIQYKVSFDVKGGLVGALDCDATNAENTWIFAEAGKAIDSVAVSVELPESVGNDYQDKTDATIITVKVEAVQGNAKMEDEWDGTASIEWFLADTTKDTFSLSTAEDLAGLAALANGTGTLPADVAATLPENFDGSFDGKTFKLESDVNLYVEKGVDENGNIILASFTSIGDTKKGGVPFKGTFDGQGHTISNLYQSGWDFGYEWGSYGSLGLFSNLESATVKNLTVSGMNAQVEGGDISFIAGSATGDCVFENITIEDSDIGTYNNGCGGIIGWSGAGTYTFKNITLAEDVVLGGLWGSFDSSIGGIVGQAEPGATYNFENIEINCRIDAYNDCTASYDYYNYRMCGMIIGRLAKTTTIDGVNYPDTSKYNITCNNVTVNYGDWMNYHYCEPTPGLNGGRGMRVEPGYAYGGLPADFDHSQCVDNHMAWIPFDQIFGGDQIGVKGLKAYDGVKVNYPASFYEEQAKNS